ncbi:MAG: sigma 54-interacting transcriptional regulator [Bifidobacteriaceae bacterium]|jgi:hypothetical protein|nr:sigma 54-interacting transcriptional regulator [Bifidobacteriaceae bacterium]
MNRCLIVGAVPQAVVSLVEQHGYTVSRAKPDDDVRTDGTHMIVHVPKDAAGSLSRLRAWLDEAEEAGLRVGLTSAAGMSSDVSRLLFHLSPHVQQLLNEQTEAVADAVEKLLAKDAYDEHEKDDDVKLGRGFNWTDDPGEYRAQRQLSLRSETMGTFLKQLRDAVAAMQAPFPEAARRSGRTPPWDPSGALTKRDSLPTSSPSLRDVYRLHESKAARGLLRPGGARDGRPDTWKVPKLLVSGESGAGKTLVAELVTDAIAYELNQAAETFPYRIINCPALTAANLNHELFGAAGGMFSDVVDPVVGSLAQAAYGVAFLDEIGDLEQPAQRGLLVYFEDGMIRPSGIEPFPGFVRIIAATNRDIPLMINRQQFRNDLYARFELRIEIPPLRAREPTELEHLIHFVAINPACNSGRAVSHISRNALTNLSKREYRNGNFRELETVVHTAIANARERGSKCIRTRDLIDPEEPRAVLDSESNVIEISTPLAGPTVDVVGAKDIQRAAAYARAPVLRHEGTGVEYVITPNAVYRHKGGNGAKP